MPRMATSIDWPIDRPPVTFRALTRLFNHATEPAEPAFLAIWLCYDGRDGTGFRDLPTLLRRRAI